MHDNHAWLLHHHLGLLLHHHGLLLHHHWLLNNHLRLGDHHLRLGDHHCGLLHHHLSRLLRLVIVVRVYSRDLGLRATFPLSDHLAVDNDLSSAEAEEDQEEGESEAHYTSDNDTCDSASSDLSH